MSNKARAGRDAVRRDISDATPAEPEAEDRGERDVSGGWPSDVVLAAPLVVLAALAIWNIWQLFA